MERLGCITLDVAAMWWLRSPFLDFMAAVNANTKSKNCIQIFVIHASMHHHVHACTRPCIHRFRHPRVIWSTHARILASLHPRSSKTTDATSRLSSFGPRSSLGRAQASRVRRLNELTAWNRIYFYNFLFQIIRCAKPQHLPLGSF